MGTLNFSLYSLGLISLCIVVIFVTKKISTTQVISICLLILSYVVFFASPLVGFVGVVYRVYFSFPIIVIADLILLTGTVYQILLRLTNTETGPISWRNVILFTLIFGITTPIIFPIIFPKLVMVFGSISSFLWALFGYSQ